jgi:hypothetical protein
MRTLALCLMGFLCMIGVASAGTIPFTTVNNASAWTVQWSDGTNTYTGNPFNMFTPSNTDISFTSTSFRPSLNDPPGPASLVGGATSTGNWNGVWIATFVFSLPAGFFDPSLAIDQLFTDDRMVIFLNGTPVADRVVDVQSQTPSGPGTIYTSLTGSTNQAHNFQNLSSYLITNPSLFQVGLNTISVIVNNTGNNGLNTVPTNFVSDSDRSAIRIEGLISFQEVPEPATLAMFGAGLLALALLRNRR